MAFERERGLLVLGANPEFATAARKLGELLSMLDEFTPDFPIMEPKQAKK